jgi:hypothetical protein
MAKHDVGGKNARPGRRSAEHLRRRQRMRFPRSGGYVVDTGVAYDLTVEGRDALGNLLPSSIDGRYVFARGAIVNFNVTL